jgi:hypothetical protein
MYGIADLSGLDYIFWIFYLKKIQNIKKLLPMVYIEIAKFKCN